MAPGSKRDIVPVEERGGYDYWLAANLLEFCSAAYDCNLGTKTTKIIYRYRVDAMTDAVIHILTTPKSRISPLPFTSYLSPITKTMLTTIRRQTGIVRIYRDPS